MDLLWIMASLISESVAPNILYAITMRRMKINIRTNQGVMVEITVFTDGTSSRVIPIRNATRMCSPCLSLKRLMYSRIQYTRTMISNIEKRNENLFNSPVSRIVAIVYTSEPLRADLK